MNEQRKYPDAVEQESGVLAWFAKNTVAANLLLLFVIGAGALTLAQMKIEVFPEIDPDLITVNVPYPGATPEEVEKGIIQRIEDAVAEVDGIDEVRGVAVEGLGSVSIEIEQYADDAKVLDDVKAAVDRIDTFPEEAEQAVVSIATTRVQVLMIALYGDVPDRTLKEQSERIKDDLTAMDEISTIRIDGLPDYEIGIEVSERTLRRYGLTFSEVADAVRASSIDLPAGSVKTAGGEILIRTTGQAYRGREFENVVLRTRPDGTSIRVRDVAAVKDDFAEVDYAIRFDGSPGVILSVFRVGNEGALDVAAAVKDYVDDYNDQLPAGLSMATYGDRSIYLKGRINLLLKNAAIGLVLVFIALALFLDLRLAFWTTIGIPMSFLGAFFFLPIFGVSVNMISLFAFIVVLGIVVDDAIVVGENIFAHRERGKHPVQAAIDGVREMALPVTFAILTTVVAFAPLTFGEGTFGQILRVIPIVVIAVLLMSLVEAFLILPAHLSGGRMGGRGGPIARLQKIIRRALDRVIDGPYRKTLAVAVRNRYAALAVAIALMTVTIGWVAGGHVGWTFFPNVDADNMVAALEMPQGTPVEVTEKYVRRIEQAAAQLQREYADELAEGEQLIAHYQTTVGAQPVAGIMAGGGGPEAGSVESNGSHLAEVNIELLPAEQRGNISTKDLTDRWRELVGEVPGANSLVFVSSFFDAGDPINVQLSHANFDRLTAAIDELKTELGTISGVTELTDTFREGKREIEITGLKPLGEALGVRRSDIARQVRQAFYGEEAQRIQRGRDEIKVMVRYPRAERESIADIENMRIRLPGGREVAFGDVAEWQFGRSYAQIDRTDRRRVISVTGDIDTQAEGANAQDINNKLREDVLPRLMAKYPGLSWSMEGEQKEQAESMNSLFLTFSIAMLAIYGLLAVQFRSYIQPAIIMSAIPFGIIGAVAGHTIMGIPLSFMSMFGIVALTGVVVNDSLIMIDLINRERRSGISLAEVIEHSGTRRFRPILLTTLTTFFGLTPMILETSLQAKFLIPMAVSLGFGVAFATTITLLLVPTLYMIIEDIRPRLTWFVREAVPGGAAFLDEPVAVPIDTEHEAIVGGDADEADHHQTSEKRTAPLDDEADRSERKSPTPPDLPTTKKPAAPNRELIPPPVENPRSE